MNNKNLASSIGGCIGIVFVWIFLVSLAACFCGGLIWFTLWALENFGVIG